MIISKRSQTIKLIGDYSNIPINKSYYTDTVINWGTVIPINAMKIYNKPESVRLSSDKPRCRIKLAESGIHVPKMTEDLPCIGRIRYHSKGQGFFYCQTPMDIINAKLNGAVYFSEVYRKTQEFRVHVASGRVLFISEKIGDSSKMIWNYNNGFRFHVVRRSQYDYRIVDLAIQAVQAVGLDFGAVDIMVGSNPYAVVSEINTTPKLSPYGIRKYSEYFSSILRKESA